MTAGTTHLSALLPQVLPYVPDVPEVLACEQLRMAAREWCHNTRVWRHVATQTIGASDQGTAITVAPDYADIVQIESAAISGNRLDPISHDATVGVEFAGEVRHITQVGLDTVTLLPFAAGDLSLTLFLKPRNGASYGQGADEAWHNYFDRLPTAVVQNDGDHIAKGAIALLKMQTRAEYYDPDGAAVARAMFNAEMANRSTRSTIGQQRAPMRTTASWM